MADAFAAFLTNRHLLTAIVALILAQVLKTFFNYWRTGSWQKALALLFSTGGMPSSHSALGTSLAMSIGLHEGFDSTLFAVSAVLALVVMHDAQGIRRAAGQQAIAINFLFSKLENQGIKLDTKLKELLGHRPVEVMAGAILGLIVTTIAFTLFPTGQA